MMKRIKIFTGILIMSGFILFTGELRAQTVNNQDSEKIVDQEKKEELKRDSEAAKSAFIQNSQDLDDLFDTAAGYVIFPNVGAGAYILGGAAGNGVLYENGEVQGFAELRQMDVGLQIGGQAYRQVILFQTQEELEKFKSGEYSFSGNASAVILEEGKAKSVTFNDGRAIVTMPKAGAMLEISIGGQKFNYRDK
ncbi:lipid-binding SYLF domain-containing protein [Autumnicola edwardsiae]|uniref:Lipid-binding SYLF domain-containing protein n=1 Tax=Autumnicola edwardsiae TaxID=3075594 RepID=A0ABU3CWE4_9FLAO|nr:lipid-binding SYLF domain-containing protein [Zunongwangia sp. F297]MDT0650669.1 lipid-binding SYLF domain-containing protein [Zunongwangia sp. F297]